ncbi:MAG TPA: hypothetical protein VE709_06855 [Pseudonocardiaceae bacterium]|jgi:uncharacterized protein YoxC|nr:hypothetical protein [Pseudonocardiaceae bacterium]
MSTELLVILTLVEIVALVAVLALYLIVITQRLHAVAAVLGQVVGGVSAVQGDVALVGAGAAILNRKLETIANALPPIAEKAEALAAQRG